MKKLPEIELELGSVFDLMYGVVKTHVLLTAVELGVFDCLSKPKTGPEVAAELGTHVANTGFFLDGLASTGLIQKENGLYQNTMETEAVFNSKSPTYVGDMPIMSHQMMAPVVTELTQYVRTGPPAAAFDLGAEEVWVQWARSLANYQRGGVAQKVASIVSGIDGFPSFTKMLDLGGGPGLHCIAIVAEHPTMNGIVFDQPAVVKVAEEFISEYEMQDRVSVLGGNYLTDPIGEGYDLIWASSTLNGARHDLHTMMRKIHDALSPGGVFVSMADGVTHERTQPACFVFGSLAFTLSGQDIMFNRGEIADALRSVGFASVESTIVETHGMPMQLDIARKAG